MAKYNSGTLYNSGTKYNAWGRALLFLAKDVLNHGENVKRIIFAGLIKAITNILNYTDVPAFTRGRFTVIRETLQLKEHTDRIRQCVRRVVELLSHGEIVGRTRISYHVVKELTSLSEAISHTRNRIGRVLDTLNYSECLASAMGMLITVKESVQANEIVDKAMGRVRAVAGRLSLYDTVDLARAFAKTVADKLRFEDFGGLIARYRYNARARYNAGIVYNSVLRVFIAQRHRARDFKEPIIYSEHPARMRGRLAIRSDTFILKEFAVWARGLIKFFTDALNYTDVPAFTRGRFTVIRETLQLKEYVIGFRRALLTLLGTAITRSYLRAQAITRVYLPVLVKKFAIEATEAARVTFLAASVCTRQVLHCRIGGVVGMILDVYRGRDKTFEVSVKDESGHVFPLTGATVYFMVKKSVKDEDQNAKIDKSSIDEGEIKITNPAGGMCEVYIKPADTSKLPVGNYVYEVKVEDAAGRLYTVAMDEFVIKHVVKRA